MASQFKTVGIYGRVKNPGVVDTLKALITFLRELKQDFVVERETGHALHDVH